MIDEVYGDDFAGRKSPALSVFWEANNDEFGLRYQANQGYRPERIRSDDLRSLLNGFLQLRTD